MLLPLTTAAVDIDTATEGKNTGASHVYVDGFTSYNPNVTVLYSLNNQIDNAYYRPTLKEIPDLKPFVAKSGNFAVVYDGYWDLDHSDPYKGSTPHRMYEILGYDAILSKEAYIGGEYIPTLATRVTKEFAMMSIYKALNKDIIGIYPEYEMDASVAVNTSPIAESITVPLESIDTSRAKASVFVTRTEPDSYWDKAKKDYLTLDDYSRYDPLTLAEFCAIVKNAMYLYGEPVLTEEEENYLMETYGRMLPYSLPAEQLNSVKYLMARGIALPDYDYINEVSVDVALEILMRVKDVNSRETFKNLTLTYDKSLIEKGYYPTTINSTTSDIHVVDWGVDHSVATHYDYFIKKVPSKTVFVSTDGFAKESTALYVSANPGDVSVNPLPGSQYLGIEGDYYHFKIPAYIQNASLTDEKYVTINSASEQDDPTNYMVEMGGGYYQCDEASGKYGRTPFGDLDDSMYVDTDRKKEAAKAKEDETQLWDITGSTYTVTLFISVDAYPTITYDGKSMDDAIREKLIVDKGQQLYEFVKLQSAEDIKTRLKITPTASSTGKVETYQVYGRLGKDLLINIDYLEEIRAISGYAEINNNLLLLYIGRGDRGTSTSLNVYIDAKNNRIINGCTVIDVDKQTPLIYKSQGMTFVDYRAVTGWSDDFLTFTDTKGVVTVATNSVDSSSYTYKILVNPFGNQLEAVTFKEDKLLLTGSYPLSSFFIYRNFDKSKGETGDYLFSFKPKHSQHTADGERLDAREDFERLFHLTVPDHLWVYMAHLVPSSTNVNNPKGITYTNFGYVYTPPARSEFSAATHYGKLPANSKNTIPPANTYIPIYKDTYNWVDFNVNILERTTSDSTSVKIGNNVAYGKLPEMYVTGLTSGSYLSYRDPKTGKPMSANPTNPDWATMPDPSMWKLIAAPVGMTTLLIPSQLQSWTTAMKESSVVYFGTTRVNLSYRNITGSRVSAYMGTGQGGANTVGPITNDLSEKSFMAVMRRPQGLVLAYGGLDFTTPVGGNYLDDEDELTTNTGTTKGAFDWSNFSFRKFLENLDDWLTVGVIFVLNLLPRFFIFVFMLLLTLACIANVPVWKKFCNSVFDPYKFLTLGRQTVHTINIVHLFIMSIFALAAFGLFQNGMIIRLIAWLARAITGILSR